METPTPYGQINQKLAVERNVPKELYPAIALEQLADALAKAQMEMPVIERSRTVNVRMQSGGTYTFKYAPLDEIFSKIRPVLGKHGLSLSQLITSDEKGMVIETMLMHKSGQHIVSVARLPSVPAKPQDLGGLITYMRRYAIQCIVGIAAEENDADEMSEAAPQTVKQPRAKKSEPAPQNPPANSSATPLDDQTFQIVEIPAVPQVKDGQTNGKPWKVWGYTSPKAGIRLGTFDTKFGALLEEAAEQQIQLNITYEITPKGGNIIQIVKGAQV